MKSLGLVLALAAVAGAVDTWQEIDDEWRVALEKYRAKLSRARSTKARARVPHPFRKFAPRFRAYSRAHANTPAAVPAIVALIRHTKDANEQVQLLVRVRENHLRSPHLIRAIDAMVAMGHEEALRTLDDMHERHPQEKVRRRAQLGAYEIRTLALGKPAPLTMTEDAAGQIFGVREYLGQVVVVAFALGPRAKEVATLTRGRPDVVIVGAGDTGVPWRAWKNRDSAGRRWNAVDRRRLFVLDRKAVIRGKDVYGDALEELVDALLAEKG